MPELALTYAPEPPWLKPPAQSGLSIQDILSLQQGQRQQHQEGRLERQEERLMSESQLRQRGMEQDMEMNQLKLAQEVRIREETLEAERLAPEVATRIRPFLQAKDAQGAFFELSDALISNPKLRHVKDIGILAKEIQDAMQVQMTERWHMRDIESRQRQDREFAKPELGRLIELRDKARTEGKLADADLYDREITMRQSKLDLTARSTAHREFATTTRLQIKAIDDDEKLKPAEKESRKAELLQKLDISRRNLIGELEGEAPTAAEAAVKSALTRLDKEIADLEVDLKRNPEKHLSDFGKDNRLIKLEDLKEQRSRLDEPPATTPAAPAEQPSAPPPAEIKDAEEVRSLFRSGRLSREEALSILREKFQMEP